MMANSSAVQETRVEGPDALAPTMPEASTPTISERMQRRLDAMTPEVEEQVAIEMHAFENIVILKGALYFSEKIYHGKELTVDPAVMRDEIVLPEFRQQEKNYISQTAALVNQQLTTLGYRRDMAGRLLAETSELLDAAIERKLPTVRSLGAAEAAQQKSFDSLTKDVKNTHLIIQTKEAAAAKIQLFLDTATPDEIDAKVADITYQSKKLALRQAIASFENNCSALDSDTLDYPIASAAFRAKVETLQAELQALEALAGDVEMHTPHELPIEVTSDELVRPTVEKEHRLSKLQAQIRKLGGRGLSFAFGALMR